MGHFRLTFTRKPESAVNWKKSDRFKMTGRRWRESQWLGPSSFTPLSLVSLPVQNIHFVHLNIKFHFQHWLNNLPMENGKRERHKVLCEHTNFVKVWQYMLDISFDGYFLLYLSSIEYVLFKLDLYPQPVFIVYWDFFCNVNKNSW